MDLPFRSPSTLSSTFVNGSRASSVGRPEPSGAGHPVQRTSPTTHALGHLSGDPSDRGGGHHVYVRSVGCWTGRLQGPTLRQWCVSAKGQRLISSEWAVPLGVSHTLAAAATADGRALTAAFLHITGTNTGTRRRKRSQVKKGPSQLASAKGDRRRPHQSPHPQPTATPGQVKPKFKPHSKP
ncbi:hypothetical protein ISCGN_019256 [Ixodes scapularis]